MTPLHGHHQSGGIRVPFGTARENGSDVGDKRFGTSSRSRRGAGESTGEVRTDPIVGPKLFGAVF